MQTKEYIEQLFKSRGIIVPSNLTTNFQDFVTLTSSLESVKIILENQMSILNSWKIKNRIIDINNQTIVLPNALIDKNYQTKIDIEKLNLQDLNIIGIEGLTDIGLKFDASSFVIDGIPTKSGDFKIKLLYRIQGEPANSAVNEKLISILVMADPKTLWKNLPSNKEDIYWKEDNVTLCEKLGEKTILVSSKRGRSHQNVGSFRDDDFSFKHYQSTGWSLV
jgi:hypothetical protein